MAEHSCLLCSIIEGQVPSKKIYEDDDLLGILDFNGANPGHSFVLPKQHFTILEQVPNFLVGKMFNVANRISSAIFDVVKVHGTNLFVANGVAAGQKVAHCMVQIIPRIEKDGVNMSWSPKQLSEEEMSTVEIKLKDEIGKIGLATEMKPKASGGEPKVAKVFAESEGEDNYLLKQVERIP